MKEKNVFHEIKNQISVCDLYTEIIRKVLDKKGIEDETLTRAIKNIKNSLSLICKAYKEIAFVNKIPSGAIITADKNKFTSALVNIIKNAIEAGASEVKIYTRGNDILIENNGDPIPAELRENIFNDGFTTKENGSGLGLMLTKKALEEQGFSLTLESATGVTIFNIFHM